MLQGINVEEIKRYNESLRAHKERASKLKAEIEFSSAELVRLCEELTDELGIQVTPENLDQIYQDRVEKINNTLEVGKDILSRIEAEETNMRLEQEQSNIINNPKPPTIGQDTVFAAGGDTGMFANLDGDAEESAGNSNRNPFFNTDIKI